MIIICVNSIHNCFIFKIKKANMNNPYHMTGLYLFLFQTKYVKLLTLQTDHQRVKSSDYLATECNVIKKNLHRKLDCTSSPWRQHSSQGEPPANERRGRSCIQDPAQEFNLNTANWKENDPVGDLVAVIPSRMPGSRQVCSSVPVLEHRGFNLQDGEEEVKAPWDNSK